MTSESDGLVTKSGRVGRRLPDLVIGDYTETQIFDFAPAFDADRLHWTGTDDIAGELMDALSAVSIRSWTRAWSDGQPRLWVDAGQGERARGVVRSWCEHHGYEPVNLRVEKNVTFRDLLTVPKPLIPELIGVSVDWLYPRVGNIRYRLARELDLVDDDDIRSLMYMYVHDLVDRYDDRKTGVNGRVNFLTFLLGKMRTWPQDVARAQHGRVVIADRLALGEVNAHTHSTLGRSATEQERADALGVTITELRERESTLAALSAMRHYVPLEASDGYGNDAIEASIAPENFQRQASVEPGIGFVQAERDFELTRALLAAVTSDTSKRGGDPLALAAAYLTFWEGRSRGEVAEDLSVSPKVAGSALKRAVQGVDVDELTYALADDQEGDAAPDRSSS